MPRADPNTHPHLTLTLTLSLALTLTLTLTPTPNPYTRYLEQTVFPTYTQHQHIKLSSSGQELGGAMLFPSRLGFSGTPSDLLPLDLGRWGYVT